MATCEYCQKEILKTGVCPDCGTEVYSSVGKIICGPTAEDMSHCAIHLTDRYLILCRMGKGEVRAKRVSGAGGLLGVLLTEAATTKTRACGYYTYREIAKGIFPYRAKGIKKKNAIKLIRTDGAEMILIVDQPGLWDSVGKALKKTVEGIRARIPVVENGENIDHGNLICAKPWVTVENFDRYQPNFTAPRAQEPQPAPPQPKPVAQKPAEPKPAAPKSAAKAVKKIRCTSCGTTIDADSTFCDYCGTRIAPIQSKKEEKPSAPAAQQCKNCGNKLTPKSKFCDHCGTSVEPQTKAAEAPKKPAAPRCKNCGAKLALKSKFCDQCGTKVEPEKTQFDVLLVDAGDAKLDVLEAICDHTELGLKEAKLAIETCPKVIKTGLSKAEAEKLAEALHIVGATVSMI